jgi:flavin reductase (DIM6/NTAB) family NADH-FMN oxidoreductase RutF
MLPNEIKSAMQGVFPSSMVTCSLDGTPNATVISQVWYVDPEHVAVSFQFFNKTIRNIRENPHAFVKIYDPASLLSWELELLYDHSETEGPIFDEMEIKLEAIASMTGMEDVFKLQAADIYKVKSVRKCTEELVNAGVS